MFFTLTQKNFLKNYTYAQFLSTFVSSERSQKMEESAYSLFNLGYVIIFAFLGLFSMVMHVSKDEQFRNYRKSRKILTGAFFMMAAYCATRLISPYSRGEYLDFWLFVVVSFIFSWLNYTAFLVLISAEHKVRRHFVLDGIIPAVLFLVVGLIGLWIKPFQLTAEIIFGVVFISKCIWMFVLCDREWRKVNSELMNNFDTFTDIKWMRILVWLTFFLSVTTLVAFYVYEVSIAQSIIAPIVYVYMLVKIINYLPRKIDELRINNIQPTKIAIPKAKDFTEKLQPKIDAWINEKGYCKPNLSIRDVAIQMGTNHSYLSAHLNTNLNLTFQEWLNRLRIEEAKRILTSENIPIEDVGVRVGYPQNYNFSRWFKTITDTTPFRYRKEQSRSKK